MAGTKRTHVRWTTTLAAGASIALAASVWASTGPPTHPTTDVSQEITAVARDLLLHVEAVEVILGAQTAAQKAATAAAGGAVVTSETASGSTRTTITGPDVTLNAGQLDQIRTHLKEIRRLLERK